MIEYINALLWCGITFRVYSCLVLSVPRISSGSTVTLIRIKQKDRRGRTETGMISAILRSNIDPSILHSHVHILTVQLRRKLKCYFNALLNVHVCGIACKISYFCCPAASLLLDASLQHL